MVTIQRGVFQFPNDYAIYRASFGNLLANSDLYVLRLDQARDYFKYSPTFALLFAPFAVMPFAAGLLCWNLLNALALFFALRSLLPASTAGVAQLLAFLPTLRSMQSSQSNALVAALIIVAFVAYERGFLWRGALAVTIGTMIKIFPLAAIIFTLPRRDRIRAIAAAVALAVALVLLPLIVISPSGLVAEYRSWNALEGREAGLVGSSVMGVLQDVGLHIVPWPVQLIGVGITFGVLVLRWRDWQNDRVVRLWFLAFVLVFCVIFNHRAERQSAVIAICGAVIWLLATPRSVPRTWFFAIVYALVVLTGSDFVPEAVKHALIAQVRFAIPLTALWLAILWDLVRRHARVASVEAC